MNKNDVLKATLRNIEQFCTRQLMKKIPRQQLSTYPFALKLGLTHMGYQIPLAKYVMDLKLGFENEGLALAVFCFKASDTSDALKNLSAIEGITCDVLKGQGPLNTNIIFCSGIAKKDIHDALSTAYKPGMTGLTFFLSNFGG